MVVLILYMFRFFFVVLFVLVLHFFRQLKTFQYIHYTYIHIQSSFSHCLFYILVYLHTYINVYIFQWQIFCTFIVCKEVHIGIYTYCVKCGLERQDRIRNCCFQREQHNRTYELKLYIYRHIYIYVYMFNRHKHHIYKRSVIYAHNIQFTYTYTRYLHILYNMYIYLLCELHDKKENYLVSILLSKYTTIHKCCKYLYVHFSIHTIDK